MAQPMEIHLRFLICQEVNESFWRIRPKGLRALMLFLFRADLKNESHNTEMGCTGLLQ